MAVLRDDVEDTPPGSKFKRLLLVLAEAAVSSWR